MAERQSELVMVPLGGVGEIGMNLMLYGFGPPDDRRWLAVDFGIAFPGPDKPGADVIFPDLTFLEAERDNLLAVVITHAHEDHYGALLELWPRLNVPVYASRFVAAMLDSKRQMEPEAVPVPVTLVAPGDRIEIGPFEVEFINVAHSIPEPMALAIRTEFGTVLHSGDWKLDPDPLIGPPTDEARLKAIGDEGVLALVCDSTNAMRDGRSPSESEVARELTAVMAEARGRVGVTLFSSNVARISAVARAAAAAGREVVVLGRALNRVIQVARELDILDGLPPFRELEALRDLPRDKVVILLTGSQGEPRAALARMIFDDASRLTFARGDLMIFSSRTIPGNERAVNNLINGLVSKGVSVLTDRDRLVHVSGHPRRDELVDMYSWIRPSIAVPVHGEPMHLAAHTELARANGVPTVLETRNGAMVRLAPSPAADIDDIPSGRLYRDGKLIGDSETLGIDDRARLAFSGHVSVAVALDASGHVEGDPEIGLVGIPEQDATGRAMVDIVADAIDGVVASIPRRRRRDPEVVRDAIRRGVRAAVARSWGKRPICTVLIVEI